MWNVVRVDLSMDEVGRGGDDSCCTGVTAEKEAK